MLKKYIISITYRCSLRYLALAEWITDSKRRHQSAKKRKIMTTKEKLLALFEQNKGEYISGETIAEKLSVSRAAVWKAVNSLREDGYGIDAVTNKGYCLSADTDILSSQGIQKYLSPECAALEIHTLSEVTSTNTLLREKADSGISEGYVLAADSQTAGRGRMGRAWNSPSGTGIYMSLLLRPHGITPEETTKLTPMAAVAVCEAIETAAGKKAGIKWVNDIFLDGKKVCGILTEASFSMESGQADFVIVGVGINAYMPDGGFPEDISHIAGCVYDVRVSDGKNKLAAGFLNNFWKYYISKDTGYTQKYRESSIAIGKEITVITAAGNRKATALDVDDGCALLVRYEDGRKERLISGEISIRIS